MFSIEELEKMKHDGGTTEQIRSEREKIYDKRTKEDGGDLYIPSFLVFGYRRLKANSRQEVSPEELRNFVENIGKEFGQTVKEISHLTDIPIKEPYANPGYYSIIDRVMRHSEIGANDYWVLDDFPE